MKHRLLASATAFCLCVAPSAPLHAAATYGTLATSDFAFSLPVLSGGGLSASAMIDSDTGTSAMGGTGTAAHATLTITPDGLASSYIRSISISGSAAAPPDSHASSSRMTGHLFSITNATTMPVDVPFTFFMSWTIIVTADNPALESASSGAFFSIAGIDTEELTIAGIGAVTGAYENQLGLSTSGGPGGVMSDLLVLGTLHLDPGVHMFSVITDAAGRATSRAVPAPATAALVLLGVFAAMRAKRRR